MKPTLFTDPQFALESIKNQSDVFFKELTMIFSDYVGMKRKDIHESDFVKRLKASILHHMGLHINIYIGNKRNASDDVGYAVMVVPPSLSHHVMSSREARAIGDAATNLVFDIENAYIKGDTKNIPLTLYVDLRILTKKIVTAEEHAAITLHELGHCFTMLLYMSRLCKTNVALEMVAKDFDNSSMEERKVTYERYMGSIISIVHTGTEVYETDDKRTMVTLVYKSLNKAVAHEIGSPVYGHTMFEYAADMFATRHGAGQALATGLEKITAGNKALVRNYRIITTITFFGPIIAVIMAVGASSAFSAGLIPLVLINTLLFLNSIAIPSEIEYRYDTMKDRLRRIRNQIQMRMRLQTTSKKEFEMFKAELAELDKVIKRINNAGSNFEFWLSIVLSPNVRRRNRQAELHMFYEDMAYNKLFEKSMELQYA